MDKSELKCLLLQLVDELDENSKHYKTLEDMVCLTSFIRPKGREVVLKSEYMFRPGTFKDSVGVRTLISYEGPHRTLTQICRDAKNEVGKIPFVPQQILQYGDKIAITTDLLRSNYGDPYILSVKYPTTH